MYIFEPHGMCLLALMLVLMQLNPSDAISARIGSGYNSDAVDAVPNSLYVTGVSVPAAKAKTSSVTYDVIVQPTASKHGYTLFSEYFQDSQYVAMFGPSGHDFIDSYCANAPQENVLWNLMNFAAVGQTHDTGYCFFPSYRPNIMYLFPNDVAQSAGLLHHLEQRDLFPTTQLLLYDSQDDTGVGFSAFQLFGNLMPWANKNGFQSTTTDSTSTYNTMIAANPRIVFFFSIGEYSATAKQWYMQMMSDSKLVRLNTTLAFTMELQYQMLDEYNAQVASNKVVLTESNMASSVSVPGVDTSDYPYTQEFLAQVSPTGRSVCEQNFMLAGWLAGWALMQALSKFTGPQYGVRSTFFNNLNAAQSSYIVSGFFFGSFGPPECSDSQTSQGGVCNCHQGGNNVWLQTFKKGAGGTYDVETAATPPYRYGVGMCSNTLSDQTREQPPVPYTQVLSMPTTVHLVGFSPADNAVMSAVCSEMHDSLTRSANTTRFWHKSINAVRGHCMPTAIASVISDLVVYLASFVTTSFCGAIPDILLTSDSPPTSLILDFIPQTTQPRIAKANYVYLFPTLDQELHVLAHFVTTKSDGTSAVCGLVKPSSVSSSIEALLSNTLTAYGISVSIIKLNGSMGQSIPAMCTYTFVIGAADTDIGGLVSYLQSNGNYILVPFDDVTKLYSSIVLAMDGVAPDVTNRFVFATNLPALTADTMSSSEVDKAEAIADVASFVRTLPTTAQTPAAVRGYIVSMMYDRLTMGTSWGLPNLQEALYGNVTLRVGGMTFGPFTSTWSGASQKLINFGATNIAVWSYTRVVDPSTPLLASPITPSLSFLEKPSVALMDLWLAAGEADQHSCFQLQASSSSFSEPEPTPTPTPTPTQTETHHANTTSRPPVESSSSSSTLRLVAIVLGALLALVVLYIVVLLMLKFEVLQRLVVCLWCCGGESTSRQDATQLRKRFDGGCLCDLELLREARNVSRAPEESTGMVTCVVFVEVEHWRALWVRHPESMARVIRQYHRCLRRAVVKHGCYEMVSREGMYVVACPSSDAGVQLASDTVTGVAALRNSDNDIIHAAYAEFGFGDGVASGLRLRVAVHTGAVERHADASSRVHLRGNAVDGAVSAAYCAGRPGMAVVTANTMRRLCDNVAGELLKAEVVGKCRFVSESAEEELLGIWLLRAQRPSTVARRLHDTDAHVALHILGSSSFESTPAFTLCKERLTMHYAEIPQHECVADLMWMNQRFGLPEVLVGRYQNDHELCDALMASVSGHISCMMECRHGVLRAARLQRRGIRELNASGSQMGEWGIRSNLSVPGRRSYRRIKSGSIRTFAYSMHHEKSERQTNVETR